MDRNLEGAVKAWSVRKRMMAERWDNECLSKFQSNSPGQPGSTGIDDKRKDDRLEEEPPSEGETTERFRFLKLRKKHFKKCGHSEECPGCIRMRRDAKPPYRHNDPCRKRMYDIIQREEPDRWRRHIIRRHVVSEVP